MEKRSVFSTLRFIFLTILTLVLIFSAVIVTVMNTYKPAVKTYINGKFIGYFTNEQHFDDIYNDLVAEKQSIDSNVKVYLDSEPNFEDCYIRDNMLVEQNIYTNLRAEIKTEYTVYEVAVNGEIKMKFNSQDEANKYAESLKSQVSKLSTEIKTEKLQELGEVTTLERADAIMKDIVDRNKPVTIPKSTSSSTYKVGVTKSNNTVPDSVAASASAQGGIWPTTARYISSPYGWRSGSFHSGVDIAGPSGSPIYAYKGGMVTFAGWNTGGYGNLVQISHGNGFSTWYAHCSKIYVKAGDIVTQGQTISAMGTTGNSTGNHLHFEVRLSGVHVNSYSYISQYK